MTVEALAGEPAAMIIGVDSREFPRSSRNAAKLAETLLQCGFSEDRIILLTSDSENAEGKPAFDNIESQFDRFASLIGSDDDLALTVWIGPCCVISGELLFCPEGGDFHNPRSMIFITEQLEKAQPKRLVMLIDSFFPDDVPERMRPLSVTNVDRSGIPENAVLFMNDSTLSDGMTLPRKSLSEYFGDVLEKDAADLNGDGKTEVRELLRYFEVHRERLVYKGFRAGGEWDDEHFATKFVRRSTPRDIPFVIPPILPPGLDEAETERPLFGHESVIAAHPDHAVVSLAFFRRGAQTCLVSAGADQMIRIHRLPAMKQVFEKRYFGEITSVTADTTDTAETRLLIAARDMQVELWRLEDDSESGSEAEEFAFEERRIFDQLQDVHPDEQGIVRVAFDPTGGRFLAATAQSICIWEDDPQRDFPVKIVRSPMSSLFFEAAAAVFIPRKEQVLTAFAESPVSLWNMSGGWENADVIREFHQFGVVNDLAYSPESGKLVSAGNNDKAVVWDIPKNEPALQFDSHGDDVTAVAFSPDGERVLSGSLDGTGMLWDSVTGEMSRPPISGSGSGVLCVAFSADGRFCALGLSNGNIILCSNEGF